MTTKTETLTIPELCKRLGKQEYDSYAMIDGNKTLVGSTLPKKGLGKLSKILSINDKFPTDICETCGCKEFSKKCTKICKKHKWKPLLRTVKNIRLVERKCRHLCTGNKEIGRFCKWCGEGGALANGELIKPVQTVEIQTSCDSSAPSAKRKIATED